MCSGKIEQHVNDRGGGSRYCLDGCGYYEELPPGSMRPEPPRQVSPAPPRRRQKKRRE